MCSNFCITKRKVQVFVKVKKTAAKQKQMSIIRKSSKSLCFCHIVTAIFIHIHSAKGTDR